MLLSQTVDSILFLQRSSILSLYIIEWGFPRLFPIFLYLVMTYSAKEIVYRSFNNEWLIRVKNSIKGFKAIWIGSSWSYLFHLVCCINGYNKMVRMTKSMFSWWKLYLFAVMLVTKSPTFNCYGNFGKLLRWTSANPEKMPDFLKSISSVVGHKLPWFAQSGACSINLYPRQ